MSSRRRLALSCASCVRVDLGRGARAMSRRVPTRRRARCEMHGHASSAHLRAHAASAACALRFFSVPSLVDASTLRRTRAACRPTAPVGARLTTRALRHRPWLQCLRPRQPRPFALVHARTLICKDISHTPDGRAAGRTRAHAPSGRTMVGGSSHSLAPGTTCTTTAKETRRLAGLTLRPRYSQRATDGLEPHRDQNAPIVTSTW